MTLSYSKTDTHTANKAIELLTDLQKINNDRIAGYEKAIEQSMNIDMCIRGEFENIIAEAKQHRQQLGHKIAELNGNTNVGTTLFGKIYRAWMDLKVTFAYGTQKAILASCQYNEEIALHAYTAALDIHVDMDSEIIELIEEQQAALKRTHGQIKKYREVRQIANFNLMYFN